jgi:23S rRNA pseudouridine1911/1915/1917 synthase
MNKNLIVNQENRLDKFLTQHIDASRNQIEQLIKKGCVKVDGKPTIKTGLKLKTEQHVEVIFPQTQTKKPQAIDFEVEIIYEDEAILVINKPSSLVVHDAPSVYEPTLVDWLKHKNISLSTISGEERHGIVHRLDKGTSGVMVVAKTNEAHQFLSQQLQDKSMGRYYLALIDLPLKDNTIIEQPISRHVNNRLKMGVNANGKYAKTAFYKMALSHDEKYELIAAKLFTGRTHQIRVHLSHINRHILGDNLYGFKGDLNKINRFYLHAYCLYLIHPTTHKSMNFVANIPNDINDFLNTKFNMEEICEKIHTNYIINSFTSCNEWLFNQKLK